MIPSAAWWVCGDLGGVEGTDLVADAVSAAPPEG